MTMDDGTKDSRPETRRRGLISELSDRQSDIRELLADVRTIEDKTAQEGLAGNLGYPDDTVIALLLAQLETFHSDVSRPLEVADLILTGALLDHLDTLGYEVRRKSDAD